MSININLDAINASLNSAAKETRTYHVTFHRDNDFWWDNGFEAISGRLWDDWSKGVANLTCAVKLEKGYFNKVKPSTRVQEAFDQVFKAIGRENLKAGLEFDLIVSMTKAPKVENVKMNPVAQKTRNSSVVRSSSTSTSTDASAMDAALEALA